MLIVTLVGIVVLILLLQRVRAARAPRPHHIGDGTLAPCPDTPNCVITQGGDATHSMPPLTHTLSTAAAREDILDILNADPKATITVTHDTYVAAEFRIPFFGYIDDVEFLFEEGIVHFRSASRSGMSDLGVNRKRMRAIGEAFDARQVGHR